jgi:hypothetical protein
MGLLKEAKESPKARRVVIVLCVTGFLRVALVMGSLVGFNSVVNTQGNPVPNNLDRQQNLNAVPVK